jgi:hypothetical protein
MVSAFVCPVVLASASGSGLPWGLGLLPALGLLVIVALDLRAGPRLIRASGTSDKASLPMGFWLAWAFLVSVIAVEFSIVFWGATLVRAADRRDDRGRDASRGSVPWRHVRGSSRTKPGTRDRR